MCFSFRCRDLSLPIVGAATVAAGSADDAARGSSGRKGKATAKGESAPDQGTRPLSSKQRKAQLKQARLRLILCTVLICTSVLIFLQFVASCQVPAFAVDLRLSSPQTVCRLYK